MMKITNIGEFKESQKNNKSFLNECLDIIFSICKTDPSFANITKLNDNIELNKIEESLKKQNILVNKSEQIKKSFEEKINLLDQQIENMRYSLLESLGE